jgi:uncharacterized protein YggE
MQNLLPKWLTWSLGLLLIVVLGLVALDKSYSLKQTLNNTNPQNTLSVSAEGKVKAVPDLATVDVGVIANAATAAEAQDQSAKKINAITDFVKKQGVSKDDIATSQFNIYPQQDFQNGKGTITNYTANQSITIKVREVDKSTDKLSKILGGITAAGANQINGVTLSFNDPDVFRQQAREQAIAKAQVKAQDLAKTAGLRLGRVVNVSEIENYANPIPYGSGYAGIGGADAKSVAPNIEPGNQDVVANMTVVFEVK